MHAGFGSQLRQRVFRKTLQTRFFNLGISCIQATGSQNKSCQWLKQSPLATLVNLRQAGKSVCPVFSGQDISWHTDIRVHSGAGRFCSLPLTGVLPCLPSRPAPMPAHPGNGSLPLALRGKEQHNGQASSGPSILLHCHHEHNRMENFSWIISLFLLVLVFPLL